MADPRYVKFFKQYPNFEYIPSHDWRQHDAFNRLFAEGGYYQGYRDSALLEIQEIWAEIIKEEFQGDTLTVYQTICKQLGRSVPESIKACKASLQNVNVNIVDFIQHRKDLEAKWEPPETITSFDSPEALKEYSTKARKALPIELVTGPLKILLRKTR
jgi:hypothetical protein